MSEQGKQDRTDKLRTQVWRHLELGQWHSAALLSEHMTEVDPLSSVTGLAEATRALAMISEAIRLNAPVDPHVLVRLDEMACTWPRLGAMRSFQALVQAVRETAARDQETQASMSDAAAAQTTPPEAAPQPQRRKPRRSLLRRIARPEGCTGVAATVACILAVLLIFNSTAYYYLREQPESANGPEAKTAARATLAPWHGLLELEEPVDTIILGDSASRCDLVTGPFADRLGGTSINLGNNAGSSLLMDAWMLRYYLDKFGPPRNVVLLRGCHSYETGHDREFLSIVPLEWGYWDRLGVAPEWTDYQELKLFLSKYGVLHSSSDILSYRLTHTLDLLSQPCTKREPIPYYYAGNALASDLENFRRGKTASTYTPFVPSGDSTNAVAAMSEQARELGFQLYFVVGPEWDEAYQDPDRQAKVSGMVEWLDQYADPQYVHVVLSTPMIFRADQMQNINHLRPGAEIQYTEAVVAEIVALQSSMVSSQAMPLQLSSAVLDKSRYSVEEQPSVALSLTLDNSSIDTTVLVEGEVSCLVRWAGMSDSKWVCRAPATAFSVTPGTETEVVLALSVRDLPMAGGYDLVVFIRQDVGGLSYETRIEMPKMVKVS